MDIRRCLLALAALAVIPAGSPGQEAVVEEFLEARIWLDRGEEPVLQRGDRVRLYYRTSEDAYVAIFQIDTDGSVRLLHPRSPDEDHFVRGARDYRLLFPQSSYWFVDEYPGKGYFFIVASPEPFDLGAFDYARYDRGWDLTQVGRTVYEDPYVAMDDYVAKLIPDWETVPYGLDFISYDVGERHDYPRFLCYDCHGFRTYAMWNPYTYACSSFRIVIWDDPYFYPVYRYRGTRVVFARSHRGLPRFEFKERAVGEAWSPLTRTRQPPMRRPALNGRTSAADPSRPRIVPPRRRVVPSDALGARGSRSGSRVLPPTRSGGSVAPGQSGARTRPTARPRIVDMREGSSGRATVPTRSTQRPVLQRRPSAGSGTVRRGTTSPSRPGARPSTAGSRGRVVLPRRPSSSSRPSATTGRTRVSPPSSAGSRRPSTARPPARATRPPVKPRGGASAARPTRPPPRRKPGSL